MGLVQPAVETGARDFTRSPTDWRATCDALIAYANCEKPQVYVGVVFHDESLGVPGIAEAITALAILAVTVPVVVVGDRDGSCLSVDALVWEGDLQRIPDPGVLMVVT